MEGRYTSELKPCPFCGGNVLRLSRKDYEGSKWATIECENCHASIRNRDVVDFWDEARAMAVEAWNRRA